MDKQKVNNEVILMRPLVRKAKVRITRNLIREIKILRRKHGDEKKLAKFKRKIDRFLDEVKAGKKVRDDEVSKFGILNTRSLYSILDDPTSDAHTRVIAKFADFSELKSRIAEFKVKFPDYEQYMGPGRKKGAKLQKKDTLKENEQAPVESHEIAKKKRKKVEVDSSEDETVTESSDNKMTIDDSSSGENNEEIERSQDSDEESDVIEEENTESDEKSVKKKKNPDSKTSKPSLESKNVKKLKSKLNLETDIKKIPVKVKKVKKIPKTSKKEKEQKQKVIAREIKAVSKEAAVKRFTELLQEEEVNESSQIELESKTEEDKLPKEVDTFFMTSEGSNEFMSITLPLQTAEKKNSANNNLSSNQRSNFSRNESGRYFTKLNKYDGQADKFRKNNRMDGRKSAAWFEPKTEKRNWNESSHAVSKRNNFKESKSGEKFSTKFGNKSETSNEHLHPSWAAKKKQQDALKMGFQGKKIVFDD